MGDSKESMAPGRALCAFALLVACASAVQSEMSAEVEMFAEEESAVIVKYSKIPGFALKDALLNGPSGTTGGDAKACEQRCTSAGDVCKSYSYSAAKKLCFVSKETLSADPNFVLKSKVEASQSGKEWRTFEGMTYTADGWTKVTGVSLAGCEAKCKGNTGCGMLSYRKVDEMCLMSPKRLDYAPGFDCYEKSNEKQSTLPLAKTGESTVPAKPDKDTKAKATEQAEVKELAAAEKAKITDSDQKIQAAKAIEKKAADELAAAKVEEKKEIKDAREKAAKQLKKSEAKFEASEAKKMSTQIEEQKQAMAAKLLKEKAARRGGTGYGTGSRDCRRSCGRGSLEGQGERGSRGTHECQERSCNCQCCQGEGTG